MPERSRPSYEAREIKNQLRTLANPEKAAFFPRFFKTGPGEYGEGDQFWGVTVPSIRKVAKANIHAGLVDIRKLLNDPIHEVRLTALIILTYKMQKASSEEQEKIAEFYLKNLRGVNNWDLVDSSADKILGPYLLHKKKDLLFQFAASGDLWKQRIALLTTLYFIRHNQLDTTFELAEILLHHPHDLIQKATGWMLREAGKRSKKRLFMFLEQHFSTMPRTCLRYSLEKLDPEMRLKFMKTSR